MPRETLRVLFDAQVMVGNKTGTGYYAAEMVKALSLALPEVEFVGHYYNFLGRSPTMLPQAANITYRGSKLLHRKFVYLLRRFGIHLPFELLIRMKGDFILYPNFIGHPSLFKTPSAVVIPDLVYLDRPKDVSVRNQRDLERFVPQAIHRASFIITISETSAATITRHYGQYKKNIVVEHIPPIKLEAVSLDITDKILAELNIIEPFILFLGTLEPRKNIDNLTKAYTLLSPELRSTHTLVLAGGNGWNNTTIQDQIDTYKRQGFRIIQTGYITDLQKAALYKRATLFVFPSWYEGYGMPLLEAASTGIPIVASDLPVFREVMGDGGAVYCSPADPVQIANAIQTTLRDTELQKDMLSSHRKLLRDLDWEQVGKHIADAILNTVD